MSFYSNLIREHVEKVQAHITTLTVAADPATATAAELRTIADALAQVNGKLAQYQIALDARKKEVAAEEAAIHQHMDAATILDAKSDPALKAKATTLLDEIEVKLAPKLASDKAALLDIQSSIDDCQRERASLEKRIQDTQATAEAAARDLERARMEERHANEQLADAQRRAGLDHKLDQLTAASDAMAKAAADARQKAEAAKLQAQSLGHVGSEVAHDDDIQAALKEAAGGVKAGGSVADRIAAMKVAQGSAA